MIRRRADHDDDGFVHIWLNEAGSEDADKAVCGKPGPPSPDESGPPCMPCHIRHGEDLAAKHGDTSWRP